MGTQKVKLRDQISQVLYLSGFIESDNIALYYVDRINFL